MDILDILFGTSVFDDENSEPDPDPQPEIEPEEIQGT